MTKFMFTLMAAGVVALFSGCASVSEAPAEMLHSQKIGPGQTVAHLEATNWGIYLFSIPLLTGSVEEPGKIVVFQDTVNAGSVVSLLTAKSKELNATGTYNIVSMTMPMPFMFGIRETSVSANVVK